MPKRLKVAADVCNLAIERISIFDRFFLKFLFNRTLIFLHLLLVFMATAVQPLELSSTRKTCTDLLNDTLLWCSLCFQRILFQEHI